ncbi:S8 family peptidase [Mycetocola saprophilus]|uniref:S8 family peptidase n=1 Tax=Mycetocola saprophilus TaxID=76636 RepID=UPI0009DEB896|nr:S8 family serine peptidase [Mycetocola saprophilus]
MKAEFSILNFDGQTFNHVLRRVLVVTCALTALVASSVTLPPTSAIAAASTAVLPPDARVEGLWYLDAIGVPAARTSGLTGKGVRIAVVDTGINLNASELRGANIKVHDGYCVSQDTGAPFPGNSTDPSISAHGTSVTAMLVGNGQAVDGGKGTVGVVPDAQVDFYAVGPLVTEDQKLNGWNSVCPTTKAKDGAFSGDSWEAAFAAAVASGADIVSVSLSGQLVTFRDQLAKAASRGVTVVASIPNPGDASVGVGSFPAAGNGSVAVNAVGSDLKIIGESAKSVPELPNALNSMGVTAPGVNILSIGTDGKPKLESGTSAAAPLVAGVLALASEKFPDASQNQLLQALIHSTDNGSRNGKLSWDRYFGYGIVSIPALLESNPTSYPDENPLFADSPSDPRCKAEDMKLQPKSMDDCAWAKTPTTEEVRSAGLALNTPGSSVGTESPEAESNDVVVIALVVTVGALLIAGAVLAMVLASRRRHRRSDERNVNAL